MSNREYVIGTTRRQTHRFWAAFYEHPPEGFRVAKVWDIPYSYLLGPHRANTFLMTLKTFIPTRHVDLYEVKNFIVTNRTPWVVMLESIIPLYEETNRGKYLYRKAVDILSGPYCKKIVFLGEFHKRLFSGRLSDYAKELEPKYEVVYPAVRIPTMAPPKCSDGRIHTVFAGYAFFRKGGEELVRAFRRLNRSDSVLHLLTSFAPDAFMTGTTERDATRMRNEIKGYNNIVVHESVPQEEVVRIMQQADIFCLPTFQDPLAFVCLEALACGLPCVVTNVGGQSEIVEDGGNGYVIHLPVNRYNHLTCKGSKRSDNRKAVEECREMLISELADRLERLIEDSALRKAMGARSLAIVGQKFDFEKRRKRMGAIYRSVLGIS